MGLDQRVLRAESLRESGNTGDALHALNALVAEFRAVEDWHNLAAAYGQRIVCFKHLAQNEPARSGYWIRRMGEDIAHGLALGVPEGDKAQFWLRNGDLACMCLNTQMAVGHYERAAKMVAGTHQYGEYLGHLAEAMAACNRPDEAVQVVDAAIFEQRSHRRDFVESWRYQVILSGLYARQAKVRIELRKFTATISIVRGYALALWLRYHHHMPQRLNQFHAAFKEYFQKLTGPSAQV